MESSTGKTMSMLKLDDVSTKQRRIAELARRMSGVAMHSLSHHMDLQWMQEAYRRTRKDGAAGVDGQGAAEFAANLDANLQRLLDLAKAGRYRAPAVRRVEIPKEGGKTRPIGIPTFADKVLQRAVVMLLEPVYEQDFFDFSYGFRPKRSIHEALEGLDKWIWTKGGGVVLEVDIRSFFDTIDRRKLQDILRRRVTDGVVVRLVGKWLNAGVLDGGVMHRPERGTPQGGVISPMLANIYLHEVLDRWWVEEVLPRLRGEACLVRYADDFVMVFTEDEDARRVKEVLSQRFARYGLALHPNKTRLVPYRKPREEDKGGGPGSFDFLGITHHWGRSRRGTWIPKRKTARDRFTRAVHRINEWCRRHFHLPVKEQAEVLTQKLVGHYWAYGITGNSIALKRFRKAARWIWHKWLARRSQRGMTWSRFEEVERAHPLPSPIAYRSKLRLAANPCP
jgi:group II intron reverse transcriptase/maturase